MNHDQDTNQETYDDIINMHRPPSKYKPMPMLSRAAQFAPFAALSGHEEAIAATALKDTAERLSRDEAVKG